MKKLKKNISGFSLVELIVVISIIAIFSVGSIMLSSDIQKSSDINNVANLIKNTLKVEKMKITNKEFEKTKIMFYKNNILIQNIKNADKELVTINNPYNLIAKENVLIISNNNILNLDADDSIILNPIYNYKIKDEDGNLENIQFIDLDEKDNIFIEIDHLPLSIILNSPYGNIEQTDVTISSTDTEVITKKITLK